jgi:hypothetical protein
VAINKKYSGQTRKKRKSGKLLRRQASVKKGMQDNKNQQEKSRILHVHTPFSVPDQISAVESASTPDAKRHTRK